MLPPMPRSKPCLGIRVRVATPQVSAFNWAAAEALRATDATAVGHLLHMPTHLDIQVGDYSRAITCNERAIEADLAQHAVGAR